MTKSIKKKTNKPLFTKANRGTVKGAKPRKNYSAPVATNPVDLLESKFGEYRQIEDELKVLLDRKENLRDYFKEQVLSLEEEEGAGAKFFNQEETAAFYNAHTEIYDFPNEIKLKESALIQSKKELDALKKLSKAQRTATLIDVKKVLKYWEPKK
tara:strand:- start:30 stop:494 length:465 start_codon:yes stop_codon:yes gene_type:complete